MHIHADDDIAARRRDGRIESGRNDAGRIADHANLGMVFHEPLQYFTRSVVAHAVGNDYLTVDAIKVLPEDGIQERINRVEFVSARDDD
jgi:hypothetical protein